MKLNQLRDFMTIVERGGLRAASRHTSQAQPALTRSLGQLERELGAPLFERHARGMTLTALGEAFLPRAATILHELRRAREQAAQLQGGVSGTLSVALSMAAHMALLPAALKPFRARYPGVRLRIVEGFFPAIEPALREGALDFYIGPEPGRTVAAELLQEELFANIRVVIGRRGHPLGAATSLAALAGAEWATTSITEDAAAELHEVFRRNDLQSPLLVLESQSTLTLMVVLANTDLLAMVPQQWIDFAPAAGLLQVIPIRERLAAPRIVLVRRARLPLTPAATFFLDRLCNAIPV